MDDAPEEEQPDTYEIDGDTIVPDVSLEPDADDSGSSEWHRDAD
ncbi:hypothetical protein [Paractinoplanes maris]|nr:hypothetical protein [Actinoplanes maris]